MDIMTVNAESTELIPIVRLSVNGKTSQQEPVVKEYPLTIIFNNRELVTLLGSRNNLDDLAVGFLSSEGFLHGKNEIKNIAVNKATGVIRVDTAEDKEIPPGVLFKRLIGSGCGRGAAFYSAIDVQTSEVKSETTVSVNEILAVTEQFQHTSRIYENTHGIHSAALCQGTEILAFSEDIGRHNAVDKVLGHCILNDITTENRVLLTSGRVCSEVMHKVARKGIPILVSIAAPTGLSIDVANKMGVTLVASVRGGKMDVYTHDWRITANSD